MKLPDHIEAEIVKGPRLENVDQGYIHEFLEDFARRIARMVAEDCAKTVSQQPRFALYQPHTEIRNRYGLKENDDA